MNIKSIFTRLMAVMSIFAGVLSLASCNDDTSYAELLDEENAATNNFLADHRVINSIPPDSVFETGENAPYYRIEADGNLYMQVIDPGTDTEANKVKEDDLVYFRFTRYNLKSYKNGEFTASAGNESDMSLSSTWFRYNNLTITSSTNWGFGIQAPLTFLPIDCRVNIIIKSQWGPTEETATVIPFLYSIRYYRPASEGSDL